MKLSNYSKLMRGIKTTTCAFVALSAGSVLAQSPSGPVSDEEMTAFAEEFLREDAANELVPGTATDIEPQSIFGRIAKVAFQQPQSPNIAEGTIQRFTNDYAQGTRRATISLQDRSIPDGQAYRGFGAMGGGGVHGPAMISTHTPIVSDDHVVKGDFPNSFKVPGYNTSIQLAGFVHADLFKDFNNIGTPDEFVTAAIPVPSSSAGDTRLTGKRTRLWFRSATPTERIGDITTYAEWDFYNNEGQDLIAASAFLRTRQLWIDTMGWHFGQDYSTFANFAIWPLIFDIEGPGSFAGKRTGMLRKYWKGDVFSAAIAAEQPFNDSTFQPGFETYSPAPDLIGNAAAKGDWGSTQLAWAARLLGAKDSATEQIREYDAGWGLSWSGKFNTPCGRCGKQDVLLYSFTTGEGIGTLMEDTIGQRMDAVQDARGNLDTLKGLGWWTSYTHWWGKEWYSTALWGEIDMENSPLQSADTYADSRYGAINLIWNPVAKYLVGVEYLYGERTNFDGRTGVANRLTIAARAYF